ncbi:hypothetical protein HZA75_01665 [Candidatus Roizmanbacteria bacterium]|nr:hypothetical protein [Candidatus Roizmanbacteria bacterium]
MKKHKSKTVKKATVRKTIKKTSSTAKEHLLLLPFSFRRIIFVTTCIAVFVFVLALSSGKGRQSVAGISITQGLFNEATISMPVVENAVYYNLYYKKDSEANYKNAVRAISPTISAYTISYLTKGAHYTYKISAVDSTGAEIWWSQEKPLTDLQSM